MIDWNQVLKLAGKAVTVVKSWGETLTEERDVFLPEGMINTLLAASLKHSPIKSILLECHKGWLDIDLLTEHEGNELQIRLALELQSISINRHRQTLALRERKPPTLELRTSPSTYKKWKLLLQLWACRQFLREDPLHYALRHMEGIEVNNGVYRFDLNPFVRQRATLIAALYALEVRDAEITESGISLRGAANVQSIEALRQLYQLAMNTVNQVTISASLPSKPD